jgi:hypothetical protein
MNFYCLFGEYIYYPAVGVQYFYYKLGYFGFQD